MLQATVTVTGTQEAIDKLSSIDAGLLNFSGAMAQIGEEAKNYFSEQVFASQGAVIGHPWPPLSPITLYMRGAEHTKLDERQAGFVGFLHNKQGQQGGRNSLIAAGISAVAPLTTGHPDGMQHSFTAVSTTTSVTIGNSKDYFKYHQSSAPRHKIPYRPMMAINDDVKTIVQNIIQADIRQKIASA